MINYCIMGIICIFLLFIVIYRFEYNSDGNVGFFDLKNSKALRGFWCLIVVLVHVPEEYQNVIQDMIGSFAYIGVTFFFMTSAYGLTLGIKKRPDSIKGFWIKRLPRIIIPNLMSNIFFGLLLWACINEKRSFIGFISINIWVRWLLVCYLAFWICNYFIRDNKKRATLIMCALVISISFLFYFLKVTEIFITSAWCTEMFGFVWGALLAVYYEELLKFFQKRWIRKVVVSCLLAGIIGIAYLKFKPIIFLGDYVLKIILGIAILIFILILNSKISIGNKIIWFLGDISFEVYLSHWWVFQLVSGLFANISSGVFILISLILTVLFSTIIHWCCKRIFSIMCKFPCFN